MIDLSKHKLELEYPCNWCYKIVVRNEHNASKIAKEILKDRDHKVTTSKVSKKGKFKSYNVDLTVHSDDDRKDLHQKFNDHKNIQMVV
jgi:putative lipoic acid-binding regulatory protein